MLPTTGRKALINIVSEREGRRVVREESRTREAVRVTKNIEETKGSEIIFYRHRIELLKWGGGAALVLGDESREGGEGRGPAAGRRRKTRKYC